MKLDISVFISLMDIRYTKYLQFICPRRGLAEGCRCWLTMYKSVGEPVAMLANEAYVCMMYMYVWSSYFIGVSMLHDACAVCYNIHRSLTAAQCQWWYSYHLQTSPPPLDTAIRVVYPAAVTSEKASGKIFAHSKNICWGPRHGRPALVSRVRG